MSIKRIAAIILQIALPLALIIGGVIGAQALINSRPPPPKVDTTAAPTPVPVVTVRSRNEPLRVTAYGTVRANRRLTLKAQVSGQALALHPQLIEGGLVKAGEMLVRLDPRDYQAAVARERAALVAAETALRLEQGEQAIARRDLELARSSGQARRIDRELALREPQLKEKQAAVEAAQAALTTAELNVARSVISAPFDAVVLEQSVAVGQLIDPQTIIATLTPVEAFEVQVSVALDRLRWLELPAFGAPPEPTPSAALDATVLQPRGGEIIERRGRISRLLGEVDPAGRMAQLIVSIPDPLSLSQPSQPPLLLGEYVQVILTGPTLTDSITIPRELVREGNTVWLLSDSGELDIRAVEPLLWQQDNVVISAGLRDGDRLIQGPLATPVAGMRLTPLEQADPPAATATALP